MRAAPKPRHTLAGLIFIAVAMFSGVLAFSDERFSDPQVRLASVALRHRDSDVLQHDTIYGKDSRLWRYHSPAVVSLVELALVPTEYRDPILPFRVWLPILVLVQLGGMYVLLYRQCRSWSVAAFVAVMSTTITQTIGMAFWGVGSLGSVVPQTFLHAMFPLIVWTYLRYENRWQLVLVFAAVGLGSMIHLWTAMNITLVLTIAYLGRKMFRPVAWLKAGGCVLAALVAGLPYLLYYVGLRTAIHSGELPSMALAQKALQFSHLSVLYPEMLGDLLYLLLMSLVLIVPSVTVLLRAERFKARDLDFWVWLIAGGLFVGLVLHGISQALGEIWDKAPPIIDFASAISLVMLPLYVILAQALTDLFRIIRTHRVWVHWACVVLITVWMLPSDNLRLVRYSLLDTATMFMDEPEKPQSVQRHHRQANEHRALIDAAVWARHNTHPDSIFLTESQTFRLYSHRALAASREDLPYIYYLAPGRLRPWLNRVKTQASFIYPASQVRMERLTGLTALLAAENPRVPRWYVLLEREGLSDSIGQSDPVYTNGYYAIYLVQRQPPAADPDTQPVSTAPTTAPDSIPVFPSEGALFRADEGYFGFSAKVMKSAAPITINGPE
ncbi:MAG: DUF6798 domain-containing protein [Phycisphaerae bacterium]